MQTLFDGFQIITLVAFLVVFRAFDISVSSLWDQSLSFGSW